MTDKDDAQAVEAIAELVPAILRALHALEFAGRHLSPASLPQLIAALAGRHDDLGAALAASRGRGWPERLAPVRDCLERAAAAAEEGITGLRGADEAPQPMLAAYRALRCHARAAEALYPMAAHLRPVSQFFLEPTARDDAALAGRLANADPTRQEAGVIHVGGAPGTRGAFSLYVPEYYDGARPLPLVVALHGGSGNGGAFLWSWLREARSRGLLLLAPTAIGATWSLMEPETDGTNIGRMLDWLAERWSIDSTRLLLTGMSDGGTFTYLLGLRTGGRFTHLAPIAASFHPLMMGFMDADRVRGMPIHIVHGAQDWMFPPEMAHSAEQTMRQAGADVLYREIADLSHTYPRDENTAILDWFLET
ncbi:MAG TPA: phospholipase [Vineibacter sp.]|nr:phospholipase [Vineibacter sp.]